MLIPPRRKWFNYYKMFTTLRIPIEQVETCELHLCRRVAPTDLQRNSEVSHVCFVLIHTNFGCWGLFLPPGFSQVLMIIITYIVIFVDTHDHCYPYYFPVLMIIITSTVFSVTLIITYILLRHWLSSVATLFLNTVDKVYSHYTQVIIIFASNILQILNRGSGT